MHFFLISIPQSENNIVTGYWFSPVVDPNNIQHGRITAAILKTGFDYTLWSKMEVVLILKIYFFYIYWWGKPKFSRRKTIFFCPWRFIDWTVFTCDFQNDLSQYKNFKVLPIMEFVLLLWFESGLYYQIPVFDNNYLKF